MRKGTKVIALEVVKAAADFLVDKGYRVLCVNLYGSQNYECETPESDFYFKAIVIPTLDDIINNKKPISTTVEFGDGLIDVKDIRLMFDNFKKQNVNFIETLFTEVYWVNEDYKEEWETVRANASAIAFAEPVKALKCMAGMAMEKNAALCRAYPSKAALIEKYGYDAKQYMHILRLHNLASRYMCKVLIGDFTNYGDLLVPEKELRNFYIDIKTYTERYEVPDVKEKAQIVCDDIHAIYKKIEEVEAGTCEGNYDILDNAKSAIITKALKRDLLEG